MLLPPPRPLPLLRQSRSPPMSKLPPATIVALEEVAEEVTKMEPENKENEKRTKIPAQETRD